MKLIRFIDRETIGSYTEIILVAAISGMANSLLVAIINHATEAVHQHESLIQYFLIYMLTFVLFLYAQWYAFERAILLVEEAIFKVRTRLTRKVQQVELRFIENMGTNVLYSRLTQNDALISQSVPMVVGNLQMFFLLIFALLYLGYISPSTFIITLIAMGIGFKYYLVQSRFIKKSLQRVHQKEKVYFKSISHLIEGFKETKVNHFKGQDLLKRVVGVSTEAQDIKTLVRKKKSHLWGFGRLFIYLLLPVVIFILPGFDHVYADNIHKISATLLFLIGPATLLTNLTSLMVRVNMAIDDLFDLEKAMDEAIVNTRQNKTEKLMWKGFRKIKIKNLNFIYPNINDVAFCAGPFDEEIRQGELLFIVGGNGSGKSTFLKLLTGLYYPCQGSLYVDKMRISESLYPAYRNQFSIIFADFHLFDKFYGMPDVDPEQVNYWLEKMQMQHKVSYRDGGFTSTSLSTGQRKRLAFIVAMLEDKPILVMDEFAADQDPDFRQYFYETLLGEVREMGKTIIAVTHDDHYFHIADRVWKMDKGRTESTSYSPGGRYTEFP
ncbi:MAG: cyclic peptide export ABC transporter [Pseudomonadota bacterium]